MKEVTPEIKAAQRQRDKYSVHSIIYVMLIVFAVHIALVGRPAQGSESLYPFSVLIGFAIAMLFVLVAGSIAGYVHAIQRIRQLSLPRPPEG